jgi:hypothetical protein
VYAHTDTHYRYVRGRVERKVYISHPKRKGNNTRCVTVCRRDPVGQLCRPCDDCWRRSCHLCSPSKQAKQVFSSVRPSVRLSFFFGCQLSPGLFDKRWRIPVHTRTPFISFVHNRTSFSLPSLSLVITHAKCQTNLSSTYPTAVALFWYLAHTKVVTGPDTLL